MSNKPRPLSRNGRPDVYCVRQFSLRLVGQDRGLFAACRQPRVGDVSDRRTAGYHGLTLVFCYHAVVYSAAAILPN